MADFSRPPSEVLGQSLSKGYVGAHIEQGVPVLDRDLNLQHDLISSTVRSIASNCVGDGISVGSKVFEIRSITPEAEQPASESDNDFWILAGKSVSDVCLVGGVEVRNFTKLKYSSQKLPDLTPPDRQQGPVREDVVYLDVSMSTVDGSTDKDLLNCGDIGMQTSVRLRPSWVVRVAEGKTEPPAPAEPGHIHFPLALLRRKSGNPAIESQMITDLRQLILPLTEVQRQLDLMERLLLRPYFDPDSANQIKPVFGALNADVTLHGRNFNVYAEDMVKVFFGPDPVTVLSTHATTIKIHIGKPLQQRPTHVTIQTAGGSVTSDAVFTFEEGGERPKFAAGAIEFTPRSGGKDVEITLYGTNFDATSAVWFGTNTMAEIVRVIPEGLVVKVPDGLLGQVPINVATAGGVATTREPFNAGTAPEFAASGAQFTPDTGRAGDRVYLSGRHFDAPPVSVFFGMLAAEVVSVDDELIVATVPPQAVGAQRIRVITRVGSAVSDDIFTVVSH
ncbi:IPT/TIG domain-containing protein [Nonomuraea sp. NPDC049655]|uniref:IPT/TIG domain-containing protein n=1 Tax=Nonomuraea sp. NPDC049655 TaxID=3364355 RepID=UPI0037ACE9DD